MSKLYLIDGMSLVFRAYHAMSRSALKSGSGESTFAVLGFANIITSLIEKEHPEKLAVVFDTSEPTFRHVKYPAYKANREAFPEDLVPQLLRIKELLDLMAVPRIEAPGYEADDIIGTLSAQASQKQQEAVLITSDKDFYQLVNDYVKLYKPTKTQGEDFDIVSYKEVEDKFGVTPNQVIDVLALIGDSSDNIPGVKGIGIKTAVPLIQKYGSVEVLYENLDDIESKSVRAKLSGDQAMALLSKDLVTIMLDVPLDITTEECKIQTPDFKNLDSFFAELGFRTLREKWYRKATEAGQNISKPQELIIKNINSIERNYQLVNSYEALDKMIEHLSGSPVIAIDLETSSLDRQRCTIAGISFSCTEGEAFYVPVRTEPDIFIHPLTADDKQNSKKQIISQNQGSLFDKPKSSGAYSKGKYLDSETVFKKIKPLLENPDIGKCGQNIKFDIFILSRYGIDTAPAEFDSMIASYLLNPELPQNMDALSEKWLNYKPIPISKLIGDKKKSQKSMTDLDPEEIKDYACEDADVALKLRNVLYKELEKEKLLHLGQDIEFPALKVLAVMEYNGVGIDKKALDQLSSYIQEQTKRLTAEIYDEAGTEFNLDSPKQLGHILFEKMNIPTVKRTKTGFSTDVNVLTELSLSYPIAAKMLDYRSLVKLQSNYADTLPRLINPVTGRIHSTFNQTITSTGRLSSTEPNLQNIPVRTELGKKIRKAFVPQIPGGKILAADYSQIELRIMAHICGDPKMTEGFKKGLDIHSATAAILYEVPLEKVDTNMRRAAKTVNFGIMYGLGSFGLAQRLNISRAQAKEIIDNYFEKYPGIQKYIDATTAHARETGYAETLLGRRRYFPDINSRNRNLRTAAERAAINMPIQGTASDMIKIAMVRVYNAMQKAKMRSLLMIQVHDELVLEAYPDELDELTALCVDEMESAMSLGEVPVKVDFGIGDSWFDAH